MSRRGEGEGEKFLARWARLKKESRDAPARAPASREPGPPTAGAQSAVPELPPLDSLDFQSDYTGFLHEKVEEGVRRAALKKLFHAEHFKRMDGLDVYIDDYTKPDPIPPGMLERLSHARETLSGPERAREGAQAEAATTGGLDAEIDDKAQDALAQPGEDAREASEPDAGVQTRSDNKS